MSQVTFKHMKGKENILVDSISCLRYIHLYDSLDLEGKEFGNDIFEELHPIPAELPIQAEKGEIRIYEVQHRPSNLDQDKIKNV